jgi:hypothetical protein
MAAGDTRRTILVVVKTYPNPGTWRGVELSWNGGTTWTAVKSLPITSTGISTYTFGATTDAWGHAPWTTTQLNTTNFRVRVTDSATTTTKTFQLDYLGVQVSYTP